MNKTLEEKIKKVRLLIMDVDGVLTDGKIILDHNGNEIKVFDVQDGFAIVFFKKAGFKTAVISARSAAAVKARAEDLKIDRIIQDARPKMDAYQRLLTELNFEDSEVCFIGDDLPDLAVLQRAGFAAAVANAAAEVKEAADYVTKRNGGAGAVREIIELILKKQNKWKGMLKDL